MKKIKNVRSLCSLILATMLVLGITANVSADWNHYSIPAESIQRAYLQESWDCGRQIISYSVGNEASRTVIGQGNTLYVNGIPMLYTLYDTTYWCIDKAGNVFAIDTGQRLLVCKAGSNEFVVNTSIEGCTGFQRDNDKFGYLVYTWNNSYSLMQLLYGNANYGVDNSYNYNNYNNNNSGYNEYDYRNYPYVEVDRNTYYYYTSENRYYKYYYKNSTLYYEGTNNSGSEVELATSVSNITFIDEDRGYIAYSNKSGTIYAFPVGKTSSSYKSKIGSNCDYFDENRNISEGYYDTNGRYRSFSSFGDKDTDDEYPYVKKSGSYYYYYTDRNEYYKYYLDGTTLYYKGKNSGNSSTKIATGVKEIAFSDYDDGYIVYVTSNILYGLPLGKTGSSYRVTLGKRFDYFDTDDDSYMAEGYYDKDDEYQEFDF